MHDDDELMDDLPRLRVSEKLRAAEEMGLSSREAHEIETGCTYDFPCAGCVENELVSKACKPFFTAAGDYRGPVACQRSWSSMGMSLSEVEQVVADYLAEWAEEDHWECVPCYRYGAFCDVHLAEFQADPEGMRYRLMQTYEGRFHLASYESHLRMLARYKSMAERDAGGD